MVPDIVVAVAVVPDIVVSDDAGADVVSELPDSVVVVFSIAS